MTNTMRVEPIFESLDHTRTIFEQLGGEPAILGRAMQDMRVSQALMDRLLHSFYGTANWMRNRAG